jgi:2-succinyl-5-enolpyruvyl-6-hydroxy-3-cyclohexene-1-carboxylate synthase
MTAAPNRNIFWAQTFVNELAHCGLEHVCIAPGSRSTPLVIAFAEHPDITVHSLIDERCAAFFALGLGIATGKPAALVCSSGTATANFYPAVIEARYSNVPMLILTADRPPELRDSGANQTIDQVKLYGDHVLWFYDAPLPEAEPAALSMRNLRTLADRAFARTIARDAGPVHINFPFRKPLEPLPVHGDRTDIVTPRMGSACTSIVRGDLTPSAAQIDTLTDLVEASPRGLILCGPRMPGGEAALVALGAFASSAGYPVLADAVSGARFSPHVNAIGAYDAFLTPELLAEADLIIHLGAMPTSGVVERLLNTITPHHRVLISENEVWTDPHHSLSHLFIADSPALLNAVTDRLTQPRGNSVWHARIHALERAAWDVLEPALSVDLFDGSAAATIAAALPEGARLFVASSLPVRHLEQYAAPRPVSIQVYSNRGASGIDGTISSAFGVAASDPERPVVLLIGDLAFYHDLNGLLAARRCGLTNLTIVLLNNDGGGIFHRLPIAQFDPPFTELFLTPHGLDFEPAVRMYGLNYQRAQSLPELGNLLTQAINGGTASVIEVRSDSHQDEARRRVLQQRTADHIRTLTR